MKILAYVLFVYTLIMLLIHVSTARLIRIWSTSPGSWIQRHFSPQRALRIEALFWLLSLAGWLVWPSLAWKIIVLLFAIVHLAIWAANEADIIHVGLESMSSGFGKVNQIIIAFDLVEAAALIAMGWLTILYLLRPAL